MVKQLSFIRRALVREIRDARTWIAVVEAWEALLHVKRMAGNMIKEDDHLNTDEGGRAVSPHPDHSE